MRSTTFTTAVPSFDNGLHFLLEYTSNVLQGMASQKRERSITDGTEGQKRTIMVCKIYRTEILQDGERIWSPRQPTERKYGIILAHGLFLVVATTYETATFMHTGV